MDIASVGGTATGSALNANPASSVAAGIQVSTITSTESLQADTVNRLFSTLGLGNNVNHSA